VNPDQTPNLIGGPEGPLADAGRWDLEVIDTGLLTPSMQRVVLTAPGLADLRYTPGQDLMLRLLHSDDRMVNRRYTIRKFDPLIPAVTLDASLHATGPGTAWIRTAKIGSRIEAIGPRGKITLHDEADWHIFLCDETGLPGALAMIESLSPGLTVIALFEIDSPADEQRPAVDESGRFELRWLHRHGHSVPGDANLLLEALAVTVFPSGNGHAYVSAESRVARDVRGVLSERGLGTHQISAKAYWRRGLPNAEHGEPAREE
jgi:NADPH-dependent ferric siderophore reductase